MKIICIGRNYADHISELGNERPSEPVIFMKPDTAILKKNEPFYHPEFSNNIHHEVEVLIRIDREGKSIDPEFAENYFSEIGLGVDFTARDIQTKVKEKGLPWERAKAFNGSAPISKFISKDDFDLTDLNFRLEKNGEIAQAGNTSLMLWNINEVISEISKFIFLKKGDIIFTGTPKGVGPIKIGDRLTGFIEEQQMFDFEIK
ncbi:MAG: fumarylacetoacetate hydrolase family protein [Cyclobacteriaceae bacterium]